MAIRSGDGGLQLDQVKIVEPFLDDRVLQQGLLDRRQ
jgi:hypothetical protein